MEDSANRVVILAQAEVRELNTRRALSEFTDVKDITQLDHLLARGDRWVATNASSFDTDEDYNKSFTQILADEAYQYALDQKNVPCATRKERTERRTTSNEK